MSTKEKKYLRQASLEEDFDISHEKLEKAFEEFIKEDPPKIKNKGLLNVATVTGSVMLVIAFFAILQFLGINIGPSMSGLLPLMSLIGAILVLFFGLGWVSRRKSKKNSTKFEHIPDFKVKHNQKSDKKKTSSVDFEAYAFKKKKRLFRSRKDKKILGVCAGIADYLGVDPTIIRVLSAISVLSFYGTPVLIYFILGVILSKEPLSMNN